MFKFLNLSFNEGYEVAVASLPRQFQSGFQIGDRLLMLTKLGLDIASIDVEVGGVWLQTDGLIIIGDRLIVLPKSELGVTPIDVHGCVVGLQTDGLIIVDDRLPVLT